MIAMTASNSMSVNARRGFMLLHLGPHMR
jgi:hypothetical protein